MTPLFNKLNLKDQKEILVVNAPESFLKETAQIEREVQVFQDPKKVKKTGFAIAFVTQQKDIDSLAPVLAGKLDGDGILWFCYPKGTSKKYKCDFNRDTGWQTLGKLGFEGVRMVAIDEDWSALRFRRAEYIKTMKRSFAMSEEGKARTKKG
ncbi:MAG TPA: hypothetical protein VGB46_04245 [Flavisolibacter sp.]|jgi:hypothetical protein